MTDLRKYLLNWHRGKVSSIGFVELLSSSYQSFRNRVNSRTGLDLDFREAIKEANENELGYLDSVILEDKEEKKRRK